MDYGGRLRKRDWVVCDAASADARALISAHHYARGAANTFVYLHGLFSLEDLACAGVAWWIPPTRSAAEATYPRDWRGVLALSRLVLAPDAPKNAATFLIRGSMRRIDRWRWPCLVTYADEWQGHRGGVYLAAGWTYVGLTKPERTYVTEGGRMLSRKAGPKTRTHVEMLATGASMVGAFAKHKFVDIVETN